MTTKHFKTLHVWDTKFHADSVEWCPFSPYQNCFALGTYNLLHNKGGDEKKYERIGNITLFTVTREKLEVDYRIDCPAVLDLKWSPKVLDNKIFLAAANAAGEICLYQFESKTIQFVSKCSLKKGPGDFLALSLDWAKQDSDELICSSDSKGNITLIKYLNGALSVMREWNAHSLEAWIVCFDSFNSNIIYSGGDDGLLRVWDCRSEDSYLIATSKKHTAGVTALNSNIYIGNKLVSGSYDESILLWDNRNWKRPTNAITASGGLWRLKWEPKNGSPYLLAACIYGGFQIYDVDSVSVVGEYKEHESMSYGADWCHLNSEEMKNLFESSSATLLATCSFYDHKLCVSLWDKYE